ncbi:diacylglycerol kinase family protein [Roseateles saccharophilus]|uniref:Diacylglycerol kinase family enzyme n=1 Tax=Roseateles saccharophilus TaxID=304 RepID=A0A4V2VS56_ROSSA|nr:diacylglycerol kinase family enzyme [Roseateles saccharophilus]
MAGGPRRGSNAGVNVPALPPALCLLNPHAANGRCAALAAPLRAALPHVPLVLPDDVASARRRLLALPKGSRVLVAGGDGTVHQLLPALVERRLELALLPSGTGNDLARALGIAGLGWQAALARVQRAPAHAMDLGEVVTPEGGRRLFMSSLTAGFDAAIAIRAQAAPKWLRGQPRYLWATLAAVGRLRVYPLRVEADGELLHEGPLLFASSLNTPTYGSGMPAAPGARIDDGQLQLLRVGAFGRLGALATMPLLLSGQHLRHRRIALGAFRTLHLASSAPVPLAVDGEPLPSACDITVRVLPRALGVVRLDAR